MNYLEVRIVEVEYKVYELIKIKGKDHYYDYIEFEIINNKRKRSLLFSVFLDEIAHISERITECLSKCGCKSCQSLHELECDYVQSYGAQHSPWTINSNDILSPRILKFTEKKQVSAVTNRPVEYVRPSHFISRLELETIFLALQEALKVHHSIVGSKPYLAVPHNKRVDSMYQKVLSQELPVTLQFSVTRATINNRQANEEAIYVLR